MVELRGQNRLLACLDDMSYIEEAAPSWVVYLVRCKDNSLYCGISNAVHERVRVHNSGKGAKYTRSRLPVKLVYFEYAGSKSQALKREYAIKKMSKVKKEKLISENLMVAVV